MGKSNLPVILTYLRGLEFSGLKVEDISNFNIFDK